MGGILIVFNGLPRTTLAGMSRCEIRHSRQYLQFIIHKPKVGPGRAPSKGTSVDMLIPPYVDARNCCASSFLFGLVRSRRQAFDGRSLLPHSISYKDNVCKARAARVLHAWMFTLYSLPQCSLRAFLGTTAYFQISLICCCVSVGNFARKMPPVCLV